MSSKKHAHQTKNPKTKQQQHRPVQPTPRNQSTTDLGTMPELVTPHIHLDSQSLLRRNDLSLLQRTLGNKAILPLIKVNQKPSNKNIVQRADEPLHYITRTSQKTNIYLGPSTKVKSRENYVDKNAPPIYFEQNTDLQLLDNQGDWLKVSGMAAARSTSIIDNASEQVGVRVGWIRRDGTNLASATDPTLENDRIAQDLDDLLDEHILSSLDRWEEALRIQGQAYATAYYSFENTLKDASQQAKGRTDFYAAALTAVSAGTLGWLGDVAGRSGRITKLLSEGARGSIEDVLQTSVGEAIDIYQGGWFTQHANTETHPLKYLNSHLITLTALRQELRKKMGGAKSAIRRSSQAIDRAQVLVDMYSYWNSTLAKQPPKITMGDMKALEREIEIIFWKNYIIEDLTIQLGQLYGHEKGIKGRTFHHPEDAVESRLDHLGISDMAGIDEWDSWYHRTDTEGPRDKKENGDTIRMIGSLWTQDLYEWATGYTPSRIFE